MGNLLSKDNSFFINLTLISVFFIITPITLIASVFSLITISKPLDSDNSNSNFILGLKNESTLIASATNSTVPEISTEIIPADARPEIIRDYLIDSNSPLEPFANLLVETADKYNMDYRLLTAIAQKESGLCRVIPPDSHNCWGWGIHSKGTLMFDSYPEAIEVVSKGLREKYLDMGFVTPDQIMKKYAHPDSTTWAEGVNYYMSELE